MKISEMKAVKNEIEIAKIVYVKQAQLDALNAFKEKSGKTFRWNNEETQKMFFENKDIPFENVEGWVPYLCKTSGIQYHPKQQTYSFPMEFDSSVAYLYAFDCSVAVDDETQKIMDKAKAECELPF